MNLDQVRRLYFLGLGGIGMSALARYFHRQGVEIFGYDRTETDLTKQLAAEGMHLHYTDDIRQIPEGIDLIIYTPAIPKDQAEFLHLQASGIPMLKRAEVLGLISRQRRGIAVAGTHGKTTTSSILTYLLRSGGVDCTAFLGGIANNFQSNYVQGASDWVVIEADEFDRSFLQLHPEYAIITSMDPDHLDIYGDKAQMEATYRQFAGQVSGTLVHKAHLPLDGAQIQAKQVVDYQLDFGTCRAENVRVENGRMRFDYRSPQGDLLDLDFSQVGRHNVENATAAIAIARFLGVEEAGIRHGLSTFAGIQRRFEFILRSPEQTFVDDYAHHPEELRAAIRAAKSLFPNEPLTGVFQPHLYSRTRDFVDGFAEALDELDEVILLDIYPARELPIPGVRSEIIFERMRNPHKTLIAKTELLELLAQRRPRRLLTLGAGDIGAMVGAIKNLFINAARV